MELLVDVGIGMFVIIFLVVGLAAWRIRRVASWRALMMTARATGSLQECVAFLRFCARH